MEDGSVILFEYCCWTFCAWPELAMLLRIRNIPRCNECGSPCARAARGWDAR